MHIIRFHKGKAMSFSFKIITNDIIKKLHYFELR